MGKERVGSRVPQGDLGSEMGNERGRGGRQMKKRGRT